MVSALVSTFQSLHEQRSILMLPNAWDAVSALLQQRCGAKAIGTSSAALCWALGYPDASQLPTMELLGAVRRISRRLEVPLTIDIEDGYSSRPSEVADLAVAIREAGAVGINIEDGMGHSELLAEKIAAIRTRLPPEELFINARTDVYLQSIATGQEAVSLVVERAMLYSSAGANGLFVPGLTALPAIAHIADSTSLPLNVMALRGLPTGEEIRTAGIRRLSVGPALFLSAYRKLLDDTNSFFAGDSAQMFMKPLSFGDVNDLCTQKSSAAA